jgi:hypothetical protein
LLEGKIERLRSDIEHATKEAKAYEPDYPWDDSLPNQASQIAWALGQSLGGVKAANDDMWAIIGRFPKNGEGDPLVFGDRVYWWEDEKVQAGWWRGIGTSGATVERDSGDFCWPIQEWLHSTREDAEAQAELAIDQAEQKAAVNRCGDAAGGEPLDFPDEAAEAVQSAH